jgi:pyrroline-5-carboxylate reductase
MTEIHNKTILIIGAGNMGISFISSLIKNKFSGKKIIVLEPKPSNNVLNLKKGKKIVLIKNEEELSNVAQPDLVLLAVKPNQVDNLFSLNLAKLIKRSVIISIIAGKKTSTLRKLSNKNLNIVRSMTNTPISVGMGSSVVYFDQKTSPKAKKLSKQFLSFVGQVIEVNKESQIDTFTAIFGSGPAYVYLFIETLSKIASKNGFKQSDEMIIHLFLGSILLMFDKKEHPKILRKKVTSKGGTTEAAIKSLISSDKFYKVLNEAINKAAKRAKNLA